MGSINLDRTEHAPGKEKKKGTSAHRGHSSRGGGLQHLSEVGGSGGKRRKKLETLSVSMYP